MQWYKKGTVAGTGAALNVITGFTPSKIEVTNPKTGAKITFFSGMVDDTAIKEGGDACISSAALAIGSSKPNIATGDFVFTVDGMQYVKTAVAAGTAPTATTCAHSDVHDHYAAFGLQINASGTISAGPDAPANATGYHSAAAAIAALVAVAPTAANTLIGFIVVKIDAAGADFIGATTNLDAAGYTVTYYSMGQVIPVGGITPYAGSSGANSYGFTIGTDSNVNVSGDTLYWEAWR